jgi:Helicase conserved C-terminal domain
MWLMRALVRQAVGALRRRCISSTETFSLCVEIVHMLPNGSRTRPSREPKNISVMGLNPSAPASTACAKTASESATETWASKPATLPLIRRRIAKSLARDGFNAAMIHGDRSQAQRNQAMSGFADGHFQALVATDIASRGKARQN